MLADLGLCTPPASPDDKSNFKLIGGLFPMEVRYDEKEGRIYPKEYKVSDDDLEVM